MWRVNNIWCFEYFRTQNCLRTFASSATARYSALKEYHVFSQCFGSGFGLAPDPIGYADPEGQKIKNKINFMVSKAGC